MNAEVMMTLLLGNLVFAAFTLGRVTIRAERSRFRYRTWQVRDSIIDAMLDGKLDPHKSLFDWVDQLEVTIEATEFLTPFMLVRTSRLLGS